MNTVKFEIELLIDKKRVTAQCEKFQVGKVPQIYVVYGKPFKEKVFTFYEINEPKRKYFWYPYPDIRETYAKQIAKVLEDHGG